MPHTRRPSQFTGERFAIPFSHAAATAPIAIKLWDAPRKFVLERVWYNNVTGLAQDATNFFDIRILQDAILAANHSTETGEEGTLTADTPVELVLSTVAGAIVFAAGDEVILDLAEGGAASLPAGTGVIEGRYL